MRLVYKICAKTEAGYAVPVRVTVLVASKSPALAEGLTYEAGDDVRPGDLVRVPLRKSTAEGIVWELHDDGASMPIELRAVSAVLQPGFVQPSLLAVVRWLCRRFAVRPRQALGAVLPAPPWGKLCSTETVLEALLQEGEPRGPRQREALGMLRAAATAVPEKELGATGAVLRGLIDGGWAVRATRTPVPLAPKRMAYAGNGTPLTQGAALIRGGERSQRYEHALASIAATLAAGRRAIVLAPDLGVARRWEARLSAMLEPGRLALLHSDAQQQRSRWNAVLRGSIDVVIGTRSAVFAPVAPLGLIVIDDEEDWSYKSERTPRIHARDAAEERCRNDGAALLLLSAAPSSETWLRAERGELATLVEPPPKRATVIVDAATAAWGKSYPLSPPLLAGIQKRLAAGERCALFFNRRGIATGILCLQCRRRLLSSVTQLPLVLHRSAQGTPELVDHATGQRTAVPAICPSCGSAELKPVGAGTARLEDLLQQHFPQARIGRIDADAVAPGAANAQIVVGTQGMLRKGILEHCSLVAVVLADIGLSLPHYRAGERVVHTLAHIRDVIPPSCELLVQTFRPDAPELAWLRSGDVAPYFAAEIAFRTQLGYPPAVPLTQLTPRDRTVQELSTLLQKHAHSLGIAARITVEKGFDGSAVVNIRSTKTDALLTGADLSSTIVDRDPLW